MGDIEKDARKSVDPGDFNPLGRGSLPMSREGPCFLLSERGFVFVFERSTRNLRSSFPPTPTKAQKAFSTMN